MPLLCFFFWSFGLLLLYLEVDVDTYGVPSLHYHEALHVVVCESRPHYQGGGIGKSVHIHLEMYTIAFTVQHCWSFGNYNLQTWDHLLYIL